MHFLGLCCLLLGELPVTVARKLLRSFNLKVKQEDGFSVQLVLVSMRHRLAAEVGREKRCWHPDLLRQMLSPPPGQWWLLCLHCTGVWCHHRSHPPPSPPPEQTDWSLSHPQTMFQKQRGLKNSCNSTGFREERRVYLSLSGGFAEDCYLLQGFKVAVMFGWREQSWDVAVDAGGHGAPGLTTPLLHSSRCLMLGRGGSGDAAVAGRLGGDDSWKKGLNTLIPLYKLKVTE